MRYREAERRRGEAMTERQRATYCRRYARLLGRVPENILLAVGARDIDPEDGATCVCGWVIREYVAALRRVAAELVDVNGDMRDVLPGAMGWEHAGELCARAFGGDRHLWHDVFARVAAVGHSGDSWAVDEAACIETAFTMCVVRAAVRRSAV